MVDFKASPEDWECIDWSAKQGGYIPRALVELKQRVKALETSNEASAIEIIKLTNACAATASNQVQFHADTTADEDDAVPTGSLVERVQHAIHDVEFPHGTDEARAAIREVAAWMRENECGYNAIRWLEQEVNRG